MAQNFPNNPTIGELFTQGISRFEWNGTAWNYLGPTSNVPQDVTFTNRVSAIANAGTYVQMDGLAWTLWPTGNRSLVVKYMGGPSIILKGSTNGTVVGGYVGTLQWVNITAYNTPVYVNSAYSFGNAGSVQEYYFLTDVSPIYVSYKVTMQVGWNYNNNVITIEKFN